MIKKISKHSLITKRRLNGNSELRKISKEKNPMLDLILRAFKLAKESTPSEEDALIFGLCEEYRSELMNDNRTITYEIFNSDHTATVSEICSKAASKKKWCQFLYYISKYMNDPKILEIGTNLGISGVYLLHATKEKDESYFTTMEGLPQLCEIAQNQFSKIVPDTKFSVVQGLYDETFPRVLDKKMDYNLFFIDGNHQKDPTLEYFYSLKAGIKRPSIFIFDDINWSKGMKETWQQIKTDNSVNFSIDLY